MNISLKAKIEFHNFEEYKNKIERLQLLVESIALKTKEAEALMKELASCEIKASCVVEDGVGKWIH